MYVIHEPQKSSTYLITSQIVTSYLDSAARNLGLTEQPAVCDIPSEHNNQS